MAYRANIGKILKSMEWNIQDKNALIKLWTDASMKGPYETKGRLFFALLLDRADLPDTFKAEMADPWLPGAEDNARQLFDWGLGKGINPKAPQYTTLASLLLPNLSRMGVIEASFCAALIVKYNLIVGPEVAERFAVRYRVPRVYSESSKDYGPDFTWGGSDAESDLRYQGVFSETPTEIDVGHLKRAIECAAGICRVEVDGKPRGTGFLISSNLVMTNFHVLGQDVRALTQSLLKTAVRFGALTNEDATEEVGQLVGVEPEPVISSAISQNDYVVLRALPDISACKGLTHLTLQPNNPTKGSAVSILHHPEGGSMKLCFAQNGIVSVQTDGKIQYATRTSGGSSGSPCLNDEFQVIAIHHAARSKIWGVAGEGIASRMFAGEVAQLY
jgi:Trypsin-like peptidase domain